MKILKTFAFICVLCIFGNLISACLPFTFPGSIIAMLILLFLLYTKILKVEQLLPTASWLLQNMAFFFLPLNIQIIRDFKIIAPVLLPVAFISIVSVVVTFAVSAFVASLVIKFQEK
ncbi:MAG: CidA/LrgA family protein [Treponema sp.]|nr:CidA/LrgA family protein [Treponema sp.]